MPDPEPTEPEHDPEDRDPERPPPGPGAPGGGPQDPGLSGTWLVSASGELDTDTIGDLSEDLATAAARYPVVLLDLSGVTFGDSAFLSLLIRVQRTTDLRLIAPTSSVRQLFALTGTEGFLHIYASVAEALDD